MLTDYCELHIRLVIKTISKVVHKRFTFGLLLLLQNGAPTLLKEIFHVYLI